MLDSEEGGTTVLVCNRTICKRYYNWEYFRIKTVGDGFVVVQNQNSRFLGGIIIIKLSVSVIIALSVNVIIIGSILE